MYISYQRLKEIYIGIFKTMSEQSKHPRDEINIIELISVIWDGKWVIACSIFLSIALGSAFSFFAPKSYVSAIQLNHLSESPIEPADKLNLSFHNLFRDKNNFLGWKNSTPNSKLEYEHLATTQKVDNFTVGIKPQNLFVRVIETEKSNLNILTKSNELQLLEEIHSYTKYTNNIFSKTVLEETKVQAENVSSIFVELLSSLNGSKNLLRNDGTFFSILQLNNFVMGLESGYQIYNVSQPSLPKKTSISTRLVLFMSLILGGIIGSTIVVLKNAFRVYTLNE